MLEEDVKREITEISLCKQLIAKGSRAIPPRSSSLYKSVFSGYVPDLTIHSISQNRTSVYKKKILKEIFEVYHFYLI